MMLKPKWRYAIKKIGLIFWLVLANSAAHTQEPPPGPYYFVMAKLLQNVPQGYGKDTIKRNSINENLNILALLLGDRPEDSLPPGQTLVPKETGVYGNDTFSYQPFAYVTPGGEIKNLPIGRRLANFLDNYFENNTGLDLTLPFITSVTQPAFNGFAWMRRKDSLAYHAAIDFMSKDEILYDVLPASDGIISHIFKTTVFVTHSKAGKEFITGYYHLDFASVRTLSVGQQVFSGQKFCKIGDWVNETNEHLHFAVGLKGPGGTIDGVTIPEVFYAIDPFGVYDYRRNQNNLTEYNYLPTVSAVPGKYLDYPVKGAVRKIQWKTNPLIHSQIKKLAVGEVHTVRVEANKENNFTEIFVSPDQKYRFSDARGLWKNFALAPMVNAEGGAPGFFDGCKREPGHMMRLFGDVFTIKKHNASAGISFKIGLERSVFVIPTGVSGFLTFFANDCPGQYRDNSGSVRITITRIE